MGGYGVRGLFARHPRGPDVVHDVSVDCPRGQVTAVLGPNGAGKSTLLKAMCGLVPCRGEILLDGRSIFEMDVLTRARRVAYVPQRTRLDARMTVRAVVDQGRFAHRGPLDRASPEDRDAVAHALFEVGARDLEDRTFPDLSGGEQQKVLLARALATGAKTLLLDEPTAALDVRHVLVLHGLMRRLAARGWCVVVVLHGLDEVHRHADRAVLMRDGRVHQAGPARAIVSRTPVRAVYDVDLRENVAPGFFLPGRSAS